MSFSEIFIFIRSLSFGGLLGVGLGVAFCIIFQQTLYLKYAIIFGGLFGASLHRIIDNVFIKGVLYPLGRFIEYYGKIAQIEILRKRGIIDTKTCEKIKKEKTLDYFLGKETNKELTENKRVSERKRLK